jgi:hypothetical protein
MSRVSSIDPCFSRLEFDADPGKAQSLTFELQESLTERPASSLVPEADAWHMALERKALGHDLYSFDEGGEPWQIWADNRIDKLGPTRSGGRASSRHGGVVR